MKMNKSLLAAAVAAGMAASAQAQMYLNNEGTGEVLLYPVYTVENGNVTAMHIVNTTDDHKAVKVRFLEGKNSTEVLDFNLYLSPRDHFAFGTVLTADGTAAIVTTDNSCTVPALGSANGAYSGTTVTADGVTTRTQPFVNFKTKALKDADTTDARAWMGHVEVIEMGNFDIVATPAATDVEGKTANALAAAITHDADGMPANCSAVSAAWSSTGKWTEEGPTYAMKGNTGGLYGFGYVLNVEDAAAFGFEADAIDGFAATASTILHSKPGVVAPSLAQANPVTHAYDDKTAAAPVYIPVTWGSGIEAVSSLLMTKSLSNDVIVDSAVSAQTDWVVTFPTKNLHTQAKAVPPFTSVFNGAKDTLACEIIDIQEWSREEKYTPPEDASFSPSFEDDPTVVKLCYETQVISWNGESALNTRDIADKGYRLNVDFDFDNGWAKVGFNQKGHYLGGMTGTGPADFFYEGLPAVGFAATKYVSGDRSYGHTTEHKTDMVRS